MSLVGTRPPTVDEWDKYELHHRARLATKPGLTGMWQVSGRSNITDLWKEEASLCLERMNAGDWCSDYRSYENWKKDFQDYLKLLYSDLWYENGDIKED